MVERDGPGIVLVEENGRVQSWLKYRFVVLWRMVDGDGYGIVRDS
jgi:hypothetical protein